MKRHNCRRGGLKSESRNEPNDELMFLLDLVTAVIHDVSLRCNVNLDRDIKVINKRVHSEGLEFLTKSLPKYGKSVLTGLRDGVLVLPLDFPFHRAKRGGAHPAFLQGILKQVFDESGMERLDATSDAIAGIEQICMLFYKYELPSPASLEQKAINSLIDVEDTYPERMADVALKVRNLGRERRILAHASNLMDIVFEDYDHEKVIPCHGPGAVYTSGIEPHEKYLFEEFPQSLEDHFKKIEWTQATPSIGGTCCVPYYSDIAKRWRQVADLCPMEEGIPFERVSRVITVPKDSRGPRSISIEHKENMWFQQGIWKQMKGILQNHILTSGHVNFTDQTINGELALDASANQTRGTLDLEKASDLNGHWLVSQLMPSHLFADLDSTRSTHTDINKKMGTEDTTIRIKLNKFAPMGSAVCFPVEASVFWALCVAALKDKIPEKDYYTLSREVFIYGDDIIVPTDQCEYISEVLETFGLKVNANKSFYTGWYRESCGVDAYKGEVVTPLKVKTRLPRRQEDVTSVIAWTQYSNDFHAKGYWQAADRIKNFVELLLKEHLPILPKDSDGLGWISFTGGHNPLDKWKSAGHVGTKPGKLKMQGADWMVFEPRKNFGPGAIRRKCLAYSAKVYKPSFSDFSDEDAYLRWMSYNSSRPQWSWRDLFDVPLEASSRSFTKKDQITWTRREVLLS